MFAPWIAMLQWLPQNKTPKTLEPDYVYSKLWKTC